MAKTVNLYDAKTRLSELVELAAEGEEIIIAKAGKPRARLMPLSESTKLRKPGDLEGKLWIADDFDEIPEELSRIFEGESDEPGGG
jgi:prevent-host-death family protein